MRFLIRHAQKDIHTFLVTFWFFLAPLAAVGFYIETNLSLLQEAAKRFGFSITYGGSNHFDGVGLSLGGGEDEEL